MSIGDDVYVGPGSWLQTLALPGVESGRRERDDCVLRLGDGVHLAGLVVISATSRVEIGDRTGLARGVYISDHTHVRTSEDQAIDAGVSEPRQVRIGSRCWLGQNVMIHPGVTVGDGTVVGANSVVVRDLPAGVVAAGQPARVVRRLNDGEK